jgi:hypothetical protein
VSNYRRRWIRASSTRGSFLSADRVSKGWRRASTIGSTLGNTRVSLFPDLYSAPIAGDLAMESAAGVTSKSGTAIRAVEMVGMDVVRFGESESV